MGTGPPWLGVLLWTLTVAVGAAAAAMIAVGLFRDRSRGRRRCPRCWYSLQGIQTRICPECGHEGRSERALFRTRRRWRWVVAGLALAALAAAGPLSLKARRDGVAGLVPTTVLIAGLRWIEPDPLIGRISRLPYQPLWAWQELWLSARCEAMLGSPQAADRRTAIRLLWELSNRGVLHTPLPRIAAHYSDSDPDVRNLVNGIIRDRVRPGEDLDLIPLVLAAVFAETNYYSGLRMGDTLGRFREAGLPALQQTLDHQNPKVRERAMWGLMYAANSSDRAVDMLLAAMQDPDPAVRQFAVGVSAGVARPAAAERLLVGVRRAADDSDPKVVAASKRAFDAITKRAEKETP